VDGIKQADHQQESAPHQTPACRFDNTGACSGDPIFVTLACFVMVLASLVAAYIPAVRAASVDPMQTLRSE
jgi:hypothetical protein